MYLRYLSLKLKYVLFEVTGEINMPDQWCKKFKKTSMLRILGQIPRGSLHDSPYNGNIICFAGNLFLLEMHYFHMHYYHIVGILWRFAQRMKNTKDVCEKLWWE